MIFPRKSEIGHVTVLPAGPYITGERATLAITFQVGAAPLNPGARIRIGLPNTGWERPVVPQQRYWDELVVGRMRRHAPFHPTNTTAGVQTAGKGVVALQSMERMLLPDEDPAEAYWRWWISATVEDARLNPGDRITITYGDPQFLGERARIQTFPENDLTIAAYVDLGDGHWVRPAGAPLPLDVVAGPAVRANVALPSIAGKGPSRVRIALTDACHCRPVGGRKPKLVARDARGRSLGPPRVAKGGTMELSIAPKIAALGPVIVTDGSGKEVWGRSNPSLVPRRGPLQLYWGDLHAQSEYHVMHSQKKDARQSEWAKGISCGKPDDVYQYARDVSLLDFIAITDQGAITGVGWAILQQKAAEYLRPGQFVTFNAYEAGSPVGHRNVYYRGSDTDVRLDPGKFNYLPEFLYKHYAGRRDVMMIPHHVKTWTDWSFYNPEFEPVMEIYSCWGQSENPSQEKWDKGMTPGAGAWEALRRGYRLGMIASSDNHVGMPGRSYPHDRQIHTPFPGGLAAVWAPELTREALFDAVRARRCYGTTGARIILEFSVNGQPMGGEVEVTHARAPRRIQVNAHGTDAILSLEVLCNGQVVETVVPGPRQQSTTIALTWEHKSPLASTAYYYVRLKQADGEMAWSSPVWVDHQAKR